MPCSAGAIAAAITRAAIGASIASSVTATARAGTDPGLARGGVARQQDPIPAGRAHASRALGRVGTETPEHVAAYRTADRSAGILCHHQPAHPLTRIERIRGIEP